jgi:hypothetical protein
MGELQGQASGSEQTPREAGRVQTASASASLGDGPIGLLRSRPLDTIMQTVRSTTLHLRSHTFTHFGGRELGRPKEGWACQSGW